MTNFPPDESGFVPPSPGSWPVQQVSTGTLLGRALIAAGCVLMVSAFLPWGRASLATASGGTIYTTTVTMNGFGALDVRVSGDPTGFITQMTRESFGSLGAPGVFAALIVGLIVAALGVVYLGRPQQREGAAGLAALVGALGLVICLWRVSDVPGMFDDPSQSRAEHYSIGIGLLLACLTTIMCGVLAVIAFLHARRTPLVLAGKPVVPPYVAEPLEYPPKDTVAADDAFVYSPPRPAPGASPPARRIVRVPGAPAAPEVRIVGFLVDGLIIGIALAVSIALLRMIGATLSSTIATVGWYLAGALLVLVAALTYAVVTEARYGWTVGQRVTGTTVINRDGQRPSLLDVLHRRLIRAKDSAIVYAPAGITEGRRASLAPWLCGIAVLLAVMVATVTADVAVVGQRGTPAPTTAASGPSATVASPSQTMSPQTVLPSRSVPPQSGVLAAGPGGYFQVGTKSGLTRCVIAPSWVDCETSGMKWPKRSDGQPYHCVQIDADGKFAFVVGNLGAFGALNALGYQTYHANGWTIDATSSGTRFTNDSTGHGMLVSVEAVSAF